MPPSGQTPSHLRTQHRAWHGVALHLQPALYMTTPQNKTTTTTTTNVTHCSLYMPLPIEYSAYNPVTHVPAWENTQCCASTVVFGLWPLNRLAPERPGKINDSERGNSSNSDTNHATDECKTGAEGQCSHSLARLSMANHPRNKRNWKTPPVILSCPVYSKSIYHFLALIPTPTVNRCLSKISKPINRMRTPCCLQLSKNCQVEKPIIIVNNPTEVALHHQQHEQEQEAYPQTRQHNTSVQNTTRQSLF